jgi:hypothetical protein
MSKEWLDFYSVCPAPGCKDNKPGYWSHNNCGGRIQINKFADMKDDRDSCSVNHKVWDWRFNCGRHSEYLKPDYFKMANIYNEMSTIPELKKSEYIEFRFKLMEVLMKEMPPEG